MIEGKSFVVHTESIDPVQWFCREMLKEGWAAYLRWDPLKRELRGMKGHAGRGIYSTQSMRHWGGGVARAILERAANDPRWRALAGDPGLKPASGAAGRVLEPQAPRIAQGGKSDEPDGSDKSDRSRGASNERCVPGDGRRRVVFERLEITLSAEQAELIADLLSGAKYDAVRLVEELTSEGRDLSTTETQRHREVIHDRRNGSRGGAISGAGGASFGRPRPGDSPGTGVAGIAGMARSAGAVGDLERRAPGHDADREHVEDSDLLSAASSAADASTLGESDAATGRRGE